MVWCAGPCHQGIRCIHIGFTLYHGVKSQHIPIYTPVSASSTSNEDQRGTEDRGEGEGEGSIEDYWGGAPPSFWRPLPRPKPALPKPPLYKLDKIFNFSFLSLNGYMIFNSLGCQLNLNEPIVAQSILSNFFSNNRSLFRLKIDKLLLSSVNGI